MNWLSRSVSFAESVAIGPKNLLEPKGLRLPGDRCLSLHSDDCDGWRPWWRFPVRSVEASGIRERNLEEALDHGGHLLRYLELMKVARADGHADVEVWFERK